MSSTATRNENHSLAEWQDHNDNQRQASEGDVTVDRNECMSDFNEPYLKTSTGKHARNFSVFLRESRCGLLRTWRPRHEIHETFMHTYKGEAFKL